MYTVIKNVFFKNGIIQPHYFIIILCFQIEYIQILQLILLNEQCTSTFYLLPLYIFKFK